MKYQLFTIAFLICSLPCFSQVDKLKYIKKENLYVTKIKSINIDSGETYFKSVATCLKSLEPYLIKNYNKLKKHEAGLVRTIVLISNNDTLVIVDTDLKGIKLASYFEAGKRGMISMRNDEIRVY